MLRLLSPRIFREGPKEYALPMFAFEDIDDVFKNWDLYNGTYKFLLPVSVGDFEEVNVPACFSNDPDVLREFYEEQKTKNKRKAFIISDFLVTDLDKLSYSGIINTSSVKDGKGMVDKSTTISLTYNNPILTYANEGISPRDLKADVEATYDRVSDMEHSIPKIVNKSDKPISFSRDILVQAFDAARKIHDVSHAYDGEEYNEYTLFYVDALGKVKLYEIIGEESFLKKAKKMPEIVKDELNVIKNGGDSVKKLKKTL